MANAISDAMKKCAHTNVMEYINSKRDTQHIPWVLDRETIRRITKDSKYYPFDIEKRNFLDGWGQPIVITLTTNRHGEIGITMHSFGKNLQDENGVGDDILVWIDNDNLIKKDIAERLRFFDDIWREHWHRISTLDISPP